MKTIDPSRMSPDDRLAELGDLLATGAQRALARSVKPVRRHQNSPDPLDVAAEDEATCRSETESHP